MSNGGEHDLAFPLLRSLTEEKSGWKELLLLAEALFEDEKHCVKRARSLFELREEPRQLRSKPKKLLEEEDDEEVEEELEF